ncbi:MAG TPA: SusD/RagB family nutrient-binding outer membrane lipoprotein [Longimicrobium sp.]|nr:SusD/RagB family nutrient-binding outer membrane lipoprotein [Longimicrobium sp.]
MTAYTRSIRAAGLLLAALGTAACNDFLTGPALDENPNQPVQANATQLFVAAQAQGFTRQEGQLARTAGMFTQQLSGTFNQQKDWGSLYLGSESDYSQHFSPFYTGGGLVDWRKIQEAAKASNDAQFEGIAKVWEAFTMGTAADIWGDIPYREAVAGIPHPHLDAQQQVYADLQALLSEAITKLGGTGPGPAGADLVYSGNTARWIRAAHTLKARYHLHTAERLGAPAYQAALAEALLGINEAPADATAAMLGQGAGDFRAFHGTVLEQSNIWSQFLNARQDINAGNVFIQTLIARSDPRLSVYFAPVSGVTPTTYRGANQFGQPVGGSPSSEVGAARRSAGYRQPLVTWAENQLIIAEAKFKLNDATAINHLNAVRTSVGLAALPGPITLEDIMTEKWIVMFQNIEAWSDYKRTCIPVLAPGGSPQAAAVPGRLPYGLLERQNNPNIPLPAQQPVRNWNDPTACTGS